MNENVQWALGVFPGEVTATGGSVPVAGGTRMVGRAGCASGAHFSRHNCGDCCWTGAGPGRGASMALRLVLGDCPARSPSPRRRRDGGPSRGPLLAGSRLAGVLIGALRGVDAGHGSPDH